jgi:hypothetical protein
VTDQRALAVQLIALRVLAERVRERADRVKAELAAVLDVGDRKTARLANGVDVGSITYTNGRTTVRVVNERALADWVADRYPDEVVPQVRASTLQAIKDATVRAGLPMMPDGTADVPGLQIVDGEPYLSARPKADALPVLVDAIRANQILVLSEGGEPDGV